MGTTRDERTGNHHAAMRDAPIARRTVTPPAPLCATWCTASQTGYTTTARKYTIQLALFTAELRREKTAEYRTAECRTAEERRVSFSAFLCESFLLSVGMTVRYLFQETVVCFRRCRKHTTYFYNMCQSFRRRRKLSLRNSAPYSA